MRLNRTLFRWPFAAVCCELFFADVEGSFMPGFARRFATMTILFCSGLVVAGCASERSAMDSSALNEFANHYTAAWCSQHAASVASFFEEQGSLKLTSSPASRQGIPTALRMSDLTHSRLGGFLFH
jgi:hypothetical protein